MSTTTPDRVDSPRAHVFGIELDRVTQEEAVARVMAWVHEGRPECRYVVTPNVDHVVMLQEHSELREAYANASLVVADGWPVVTASKLLGQGVPERVPGSDLVPLLFDAAERHRPLRVFLLGAAPGVAEIAARNIESQWGAVEVVGCYSPPNGFEKSETENEKIVRLLEAHRPDVLVIGLGAPKQELWVRRMQHRLPATVALCVGATIDFLAGHKSRAPRWVQRLRLEWLHRLLSEPRRLFKRYARDAWVFPQLVAREWLRCWSRPR